MIQFMFESRMEGSSIGSRQVLYFLSFFHSEVFVNINLQTRSEVRLRARLKVWVDIARSPAVGMY